MDIDPIDAILIDLWPAGEDLMPMPYHPKSPLGRLLNGVRNRTGVELSFAELWGRLLRLRDTLQIYAPEGD